MKEELIDKELFDCDICLGDLWMYIKRQGYTYRHSDSTPELVIPMKDEMCIQLQKAIEKELLKAFNKEGNMEPFVIKTTGKDLLKDLENILNKIK